MRKDPTLLVNDQKRASTFFFVAATVYLDAPTLAFDLSAPWQKARLKADTSAAAVIATCLSWGVSVLPKNSHIYGVAKDHLVRAISSTFYGNVNVLALVTICDHWRGRVAEWFKAAVLKTARGASPSWVRIPPLPPAHCL
jgi:hypothetical protein